MTDIPNETTAHETEPQPLWRRRNVRIGAIVAVVVLLIAGWCWHRRSAATAAETGPAVVSVRVAKAVIAPIAQPIELVGTIVPKLEANVSSKVSAQIAQMPLLKNRPVRRGDVLAQLESRDLAAQRDEAAAALREAEATLTNVGEGAIPLTNAQDQKAVRDAQATVDNTRRTYERRKVLYAEGGISKKDLEASQLDLTRAEDDLKLVERQTGLHHATIHPSDLAAARAKAQQASNRLAALQAQISYATIRAPFDGIVTDQFLYQGDFAAPGTKMLTVADTGTVIVKTPISDEQATHVHAGDAATVIPGDQPGLTLQGQVSLVGRSADAQSRAVELWIVLPNRDGRLRPNSTAKVIVASQGVARAVVVPTSAVTLDATNANSGTVMVVVSAGSGAGTTSTSAGSGADTTTSTSAGSGAGTTSNAESVAHEVHVTTGAHNRDLTQITSGLHGGETVVIEGNYGLPDGTKVQIHSADGTAAGNQR